ncbi:DUF6412 domain-containing protein [Micromonospora sp. WMMD882]|uniref:DUF6412 domain-containing protein n=1 Tax=Micromonospora sp. WMMD882 TaxID=3015151 RepID=UPI00248B7476|nr:DUF6412 domain-containing protein [Micromonospora sp. WMMD882]WBB79430.1 DUF6412 domain-containing protein [Micromonospora sp. WMMD882]
MPVGSLTEVWAYALTHLVLLADRPVEVLAGAALAGAALGAALLLATVLAARLVVAGADAPRAGRRWGALRDRARRRRIPRQLDPDAPGRPRPRAPGVRPATA